MNKKYDLAICLEVAEHISEKNSYILLNNLTNASDVVLFSAAIPLQGGTNHINENYPTYWIKKFSKFKYEPYDCLRWKFWDDDDIEFWYRQNIMFFVKKEKMQNLKDIFLIEHKTLDLVHPVRFRTFYEELTTNINNLIQENNKFKNEIEMINSELIKKEEKLIKLEELHTPKVSVVVPVFNVQPFLKECLDSILNQTLYDIEVICGDGGSNDGSLEILREYEKKDMRVKVISRNGSGYGQSVNECMDIAKGEYIGLVESDDKIDPNMYETLFCTAKSNDLDWVRSDIYFYYSGLPNYQQLSRESITYNENFYNIVLDPKTDIRPYRTGLRSWSGIYKKAFLDYYNIRHHETPGGSYQDVGFYLKTLYDARRVMFLDKAFYMWRQDNPGSSIHYDSKKLVEKSVCEWQLNKEYLLNRSNTDLRIWGSYNYRRYFSYLWTIEMAQGIDKKEMISYAKKELREAFENGQVSRKFFTNHEWYNFQEFIGKTII